MSNNLKSSNKKEAKSNKNSLITKMSLAVNCAFIIATLIIAISATFFHAFDWMMVNKGFDVMCNSDSFSKNAYNDVKNDIDRKQFIAIMNYSCAKDEANPYYVDGLNKYLESLGLPKSN